MRPSSLPDSGHRCLLREQSASGLKLTTHIYLFQQARMNVLFVLLHPIDQYYVSRENFTFLLLQL